MVRDRDIILMPSYIVINISNAAREFNWLEAIVYQSVYQFSNTGGARRRYLHTLLNFREVFVRKNLLCKYA